MLSRTSKILVNVLEFKRTISPKEKYIWVVCCSHSGIYEENSLLGGNNMCSDI